MTDITYTRGNRVHVWNLKKRKPWFRQQCETLLHFQKMSSKTRNTIKSCLVSLIIYFNSFFACPESLDVPVCASSPGRTLKKKQKKLLAARSHIRNFSPPLMFQPPFSVPGALLGWLLSPPMSSAQNSSFAVAKPSVFPRVLQVVQHSTTPCSPSDDDLGDSSINSASTQSQLSWLMHQFVLARFTWLQQSGKILTDAPSRNDFFVVSSSCAYVRTY